MRRSPEQMLLPHPPAWLARPGRQLLDSVGGLVGGLQQRAQQALGGTPRSRPWPLRSALASVHISTAPSTPEAPASASAAHASAHHGDRILPGQTQWVQPTAISTKASGSGGGGAKKRGTGAVSKAELGSATWTLLHTLAAQFPEHPTRQQRRDAYQMLTSLARIYPCAECAEHFQKIMKWVDLGGSGG